MRSGVGISRIGRLVRLAVWCERHGVDSRAGLEIAAARQIDARQWSRREFLQAGSALAGGLAAPRYVSAAKHNGSATIGIVGAGLAGLACGYELHKAGVPVRIYEAATRVGGRCWSLRSFFPGKNAERGGEFIDNLHKTMIGYAREFGLALEDVEKQPGEIAYYFGGQHHSESEIVDEIRDLVPAMRSDLQKLSGEPTADDHTPGDEALDLLSLEEWLDSRGAGMLAKAAIQEAFVAEYGLEPDEQSCLNFLLFMHADRRSRFQPFGVFSDERYHVTGGNDRIVTGLAQRLDSAIDLGKRLSAMRRLSDGCIELTFDTGGTIAHDVVVLAIPFTILRTVTLDASLGIPPGQISAIQNVGYGTNAKMMVGFDSRPWFVAHASNGSSYSDLPNHQTTWETNPTAGARNAVITDYAGGVRGAGLNLLPVQTEAAFFASDLDVVFPGAAIAASKVGPDFVVHLEHWPSNPLTLGSYTCYTPGQFTTIAGNEGKPVGNLYFAGEHANSFYEWQGFMEGAALSGLEAAKGILAQLKKM